MFVCVFQWWNVPHFGPWQRAHEVLRDMKMKNHVGFDCVDPNTRAWKLAHDRQINRTRYSCSCQPPNRFQRLSRGNRYIKYLKVNTINWLHRWDSLASVVFSWRLNYEASKSIRSLCIETSADKLINCHLMEKLHN